MKRSTVLTGVALLLVLGFATLLGACSTSETPSPVIIKETVEVLVEVPAEGVPMITVPFEEQWADSGHNDASAEAFTHWDEDDPAIVPASCARCHTSTGYLDYIGADGTEANMTDGDHAVGQVIECVTCHNDVTRVMDSVVMPSGIEITGLGDEARCMQCHQGRTSTISVNADIEELGLDDDEISEELGFQNIHYYAAAATKYGTEAKGGYEYDGNTYDAFFAHVEGYETCTECHDQHTLELKVDECSACHTGVASPEDLRDVRMPGSQVDFDGDSDTSEGIYYELEGVREKLYEAIQAYAAEAGLPIVYDSQSYPYFFIDGDADGEVGDGEAIYPNKYNAWSPRLLKAAYNYQVSLKDPGAFAHGGKYILQLMYDSIADLNSALSTPVDTAGMNRIDDGHFAGSEEAFRHWDEDGAVPASCSRCHSAAGLPLYIEQGVTIEQPVANGFQCSTCHNDLQTFSRYEVTEVEFPSGAVIDSGDPNTNLCMNCHQGRTSTVSMNSAIGRAGVGDDEVSDALRFQNIHYFAAGATRFGTEVQGGYEYDGRTYAGLFPHVEPYDSCTECHTTHGLDVKVAQCSACHTEMEGDDPQTIRKSSVDYDGDGDVEEGIYSEIATAKEALLAAMQAYAAGNAGVDAIIYDSHAYPYFFIDTDEDGVSAGPSEANYGNKYATWTPRLLRAAYNYQYAAKDPGAFAHNADYVLQLLYDALRDMGGDVGGMTRP